MLSLDFELMWGVRDKRSIEQYGGNIIGVHKVIPRLLELFHKFGIKGTFSAVGFLFFESKKELLDNLPKKLPNYNDGNLSPYIGYFERIGEDAISDLYHFAPGLIKEIKKYPDQEIGTHTFSHYYCLEDGQTVDDFREDLLSAQKISQKNGINITSLIFPRNQYNANYLEVCREMGIICYRGNENSSLYKPEKGTESRVKRAFRLLDSYINLSGHNCYTDKVLKSSIPVNIPSSRFLRPYSKKLVLSEGLRLQRIKSGMTYAARHKQTYHLWWHPHNFGINQNENFLFLEKILQHYKQLNGKFNFQSYTMSALATELLNEE